MLLGLASASPALRAPPRSYGLPSPLHSNGKPQSSASDPQEQAPVAQSDPVVWVNTDTGVYHQKGTRFYGKTKHGKYMLESDARKAGYRPVEKK
jgi:hypothetical protein